jgi:hypothetical protein
VNRRRATSTVSRWCRLLAVAGIVDERATNVGGGLGLRCGGGGEGWRR